MERKIKMIPKHVEAIMDTLELKGFQAYLVGGAMRDMRVGLKPKDWDIATSAHPEQVKELFPRYVEKSNGTMFGSIFVLTGGTMVEVTTFRKDITPGRHPKVEYTDNIQEDSERRDFTINALYMDRHGALSDPTDKSEIDIDNRVLRAVGVAQDRMEEDPLRLIRAVRFMTRGFNPDTDLHLELGKKERNAKLIRTISMERIKDEILSCLRYGGYLPLTSLWMMGILEEIIPEIAMMKDFNQMTKHHIHTLDMHSLETAENLYQAGADPILILTGFLHDIGKPGAKEVIEENGEYRARYLQHEMTGAKMVRNIFKKMKFSNRATDRASNLTKYHMRLHMGHSVRNLNKTAHLLHKKGIYTSDLVKLYKADIKASNDGTTDLPDYLPIPVSKMKAENVMEILKRHHGNSYPLHWRSIMLRKAWEITYPNPTITWINLYSRMNDFALNIKNFKGFKE